MVTLQRERTIHTAANRFFLSKQNLQPQTGPKTAWKTCKLCSVNGTDEQCCGTVTIYYGSGSGSGSDF
jgi:hypothetical protein